MSTTEQRLTANRANALRSSGPNSVVGKTISSRNATDHGLLSNRLFLDDEDPTEFQVLQDGLRQSLNPVGVVELAMIERITVTLWRQRRLVRAETATIALAREPRKVAGGVSSELGRGYGNELKPEDLTPFDPDSEQWCRAVIAEIDSLEQIDIKTLEATAPLTFEQLKSDAEEDEDAASFAASHKGGLTGFIAELLVWCRGRLRECEARPQILALAEQVLAKRLVLPAKALELFARYQTTLDNQLYKSLRALRETQEWRLKTLEQSPATAASAVAEVAQAA